MVFSRSRSNPRLSHDNLLHWTLVGDVSRLFLKGMFVERSFPLVVATNIWLMSLTFDICWKHTHSNVMEKKDWEYAKRVKEEAAMTGCLSKRRSREKRINTNIVINCRTTSEIFVWCSRMFNSKQCQWIRDTKKLQAKELSVLNFHHQNKENKINVPEVDWT